MRYMSVKYAGQCARCSNPLEVGQPAEISLGIKLSAEAGESKNRGELRDQPQLVEEGQNGVI